MTSEKSYRIPPWIQWISILVTGTAASLAIVKFLIDSDFFGSKAENRFLLSATVFLGVASLAVILLMIALEIARYKNRKLIQDYTVRISDLREKKSVEKEELKRENDRLNLELKEIKEEFIDATEEIRLMGSSHESDLENELRNRFNNGFLEDLLNELFKTQFKIYNRLIQEIREKYKQFDVESDSGSELLSFESIDKDFHINVLSAIEHMKGVVKDQIGSDNVSISLLRNTKKTKDPLNLELELVCMSKRAWEERKESIESNRVFSADKVTPLQCLLEQLEMNPKKYWFLINDIEEFEKSKRVTYKNLVNRDWKDDYKTVLLYPLKNMTSKRSPLEGVLWIDCNRPGVFSNDKILEALKPIALISSALVFGINEHERRLKKS
jgi:hypothetical protein